jgi:hypothetical protein
MWPAYERLVVFQSVRLPLPKQHLGTILTPFCARRRSTPFRRRQLLFADRLGGLSGAGVADVPARRIGIHLWQTHFWRKPLINL